MFGRFVQIARAFNIAARLGQIAGCVEVVVLDAARQMSRQNGRISRVRTMCGGFFGGDRRVNECIRCVPIWRDSAHRQVLFSMLRGTGSEKTDQSSRIVTGFFSTEQARPIATPDKHTNQQHRSVFTTSGNSSGNNSNNRAGREIRTATRQYASSKTLGICSWVWERFSTSV